MRILIEENVFYMVRFISGNEEKLFNNDYKLQLNEKFFFFWHNLSFLFEKPLNNISGSKCIKLIAHLKNCKA